MLIYQKTAFFVLIILLSIACSLSIPGKPPSRNITPSPAADFGLHKYENDQVSFSYPEDWRTLEEVFGRPSNQTHDKEFDADILITVTNAIPSPFGEKYTAWCRLLVRPVQAGQELLDLVNASYAILKNYPNSELSLQEFTIKGNKAVEKIYKRPRGEPWYQVKDVWMEKNRETFILSCYSYPNEYNNNAQIFSEILSSISFK